MSTVHLRDRLKVFDFSGLLVEELGWNRHSAALAVAVGEVEYSLTAVAEKRGFVVYVCGSGSDGTMPAYPVRRKIHTQVAMTTLEHIIVFVDGAKQSQVWQWVRRENGRRAYREYTFDLSMTGQRLAERIGRLAFAFEEEEKLNIVDVGGRVGAALDVEKVTKKFYDRFKKEHADFLGFIKGIQARADQEWYASLMLNRMMFIYFIQKRGFLDSDQDYLRSRLRRVRETPGGKGRFHRFYRLFLLRLFHEGLAQPEAERAPELARLLGKVPYLNGGLFEVHDLERDNPEIQIPDEAFEHLFDFFDAYDWHLDERPRRADNEINPDVLGYIFEKYINQKQMGAYYTKEDITGYISRNTIIPWLFEAAQKDCPIAFTPDGGVWRLLKDDPDRYIYESVRKGVDLKLPDDITTGLKDVSKRGGWNRPAAAEFANLAETWREHVARRERCLGLRRRLKTGEVTSVDDLITHNLDIERFALDAIENSEGPELVKAFWKAINDISVLDPTCGSGAFLFASLNVLEPLYTACLDGMQGFLDDLERSDRTHHPEKLRPFRDVLKQVATHPSRRYFVLKSIVIANLYGVDIMEEAIEICKLRLFLKLVAQLESVAQIEPLPDIDFNIRPGNSLVGFATPKEVRTTLETGLGFGKDAVERIEEDAEVAERKFQLFRRMQTQYGMSAAEFTSAKASLRTDLNQLRRSLDGYLASEFDVSSSNAPAFAKWRISHQPFHWFVEFFAIMKSGGFAAIVGNPPYIEYSKVKGKYKVRNYRTEKTNNLYALCLERCLSLVRSDGRLGMIVPVSIASSAAFQPMRDAMVETRRSLWLSHFANRPAQLFAGAQNRLTIVLCGTPGVTEIRCTRYHRWDERQGERPALFSNLQYHALGPLASAFRGGFCKVGSEECASALLKMNGSVPLERWLRKTGKDTIYWVRVPGYFLQFFLSPPMARPERGGTERPRGELNSVHPVDASTYRVMHCVLNSSIFALYFFSWTDGRHINVSDVKEFPLAMDAFEPKLVAELAKRSRDIEVEMQNNTSHWRKSGLLIDSVDSRAFKGVLDDIDSILGRHYGFTAEELDAAINYDIKYRMGGRGEGEDDEDDG